MMEQILRLERGSIAAPPGGYMPTMQPADPRNVSLIKGDITLLITAAAAFTILVTVTYINNMSCYVICEFNCICILQLAIYL